ncbi:unnamed protein product [Schistosoma margrebowiei]|uniref:Uncharacterized protein n=1 Tax=Schistosoma margrebowiei TaxID=48269 RepID=A0A183LH61_9TREM|nr:unnamed protein product [Schistosoma margrebowiei]
MERLPEEFVDPTSSSINMDLDFYTNRFTNTMRPVKPVSTRPQPTDVFVQPVLRYSTHGFETHIDDHSNQHTKDLSKFFNLKPKHCIIGTNESISIDRLKAAY